MQPVHDLNPWEYTEQDYSDQRRRKTPQILFIRRKQEKINKKLTFQNIANLSII